MNENEVIIVDKIPDNIYKSITYEAFKYSIISLPFTINRMNLNNFESRILNTAKGKIAESLLEFFLVSNEIHGDFKSTKTDFWMIDNKDFILNETVFDLKNNFYYSEDELSLNNYNFVNLPALVPNRHSKDQWAKRNQINYEFNNVNSSGYLFTWMKGQRLINNKRIGKYFLEINLNEYQKDFITNLSNKYAGVPQSIKPFEEDWFWNKFNLNTNNYKLNFQSHLILTGYALKNDWKSFKTTGKFSRQNYFTDYLFPYWYKKSGTGSLNFMNGTFWSVIENATCPIEYLPSFLSLYPDLREELNYASICEL